MDGIKSLHKLILPEYAIIVLVGVTVGATLTLNGLPSFDMIKGVLLAFFLLVFGFNSLNSIFDVVVDKINKPGRPLPKRELSVNEVFVVASLFYIGGLMIASSISVGILVLAFVFIILGIAYSAPPLRLKSRLLGINIVGGIIYGVIPVLAGSWVVDNTQIPLIALLYIFVVAAIASSLKDFEDYLGDEVYHVKTIPTIFGLRKASNIISISLIAVASLFILYNYFDGNMRFLTAGSIALVFSLFLGTFLGNGANHLSHISKKDIVYQSGFTRVCIALALIMEASFIFVYM